MLILALCTLAISFQIGYGRTPSHQDPRYFSSAKVVNGNDFVDTLLANIVKIHGAKIDPYPLPDLGSSFHKQVLLINYTGKAQLHDGQIWGLSTIHRDDDCTMSNDENGLRADVQLAMDNLLFRYKGTVSFMNIGPSIDVIGKIARATFNLTLTAAPGEKAKREKFKVRDLKGIEIRFEKLGIFESFVNVIAKGISNKLEGLFKRIVERKFDVMVDDILHTFNLRIG